MALVFESTFPIEIQFATTSWKEEEQDVKADKMHLRIHHEKGDRYKMELFSDKDVFFNFISSINKSEYDRIRREQQLFFDFLDFPSTLRKLFTACATEKSTHAAVLVLDGDDVSLHVVRKLEHKIVELVSLPFEKLDEDEMRRVVQDRFDYLREKVDELSLKVSEYSSMFRTGKTPSLFLNNKPTNGSHQRNKIQHYDLLRHNLGS